MKEEILIGACVTTLLGVLGWLCLTLIKNTMAIMELTVHLKLLREKLDVIPKLEKDLNSMHEWRRNLNKLEGK